MEDNKLVCNHKQIISPLPRRSHYSNLGRETQYIMGERYTASSTMFSKRVQRGEKEDVAIDVDEDADDDHAGGGGGAN